MKFSTPLALLSLLALPLVPSFTPAVNACAIVDTTTQVAIRGDRDTPAQQESNVSAGSDDDCFNNTVVGNTTQVGISAGQIIQNSEGNYFVGGGGTNDTGITTPTVIVTPDTQVDVYSPAHDPTFLEHLRP